MKIPAQYKHRVKDAYRDKDGYWIILAASWKCPKQDSGFIALMVQVWAKRGAWIKLWNGSTGKLMIDFVNKIWYNVRAREEIPLPFCVFSH